MKVSKHFDRSEFACRCGCGFDTVDVDLARVLEDLREKADSPIRITSGCRCKIHNKAIGGSDFSMHMWGKAADIVVDNMTPSAVYDYLDEKYPDKYGIGLYQRGVGGWVHIDVRPSKSRWTK